MRGVRLSRMRRAFESLFQLYPNRRRQPVQHKNYLSPSSDRAADAMGKDFAALGQDLRLALQHYEDNNRQHEQKA